LPAFDGTADRHVVQEEPEGERVCPSENGRDSIGTAEARLLRISQAAPHGISQAAQDALLSLSDSNFDLVLALYEAGEEGMCRLCLGEKLGRNLGNNGSNAIRTLRNAGFRIPKHQTVECQKHPGRVRTLDSLVSLEPEIGDRKVRASYSRQEAQIMLRYLGTRDNFTQESLSKSRGEIDHRIPMSRLGGVAETRVDANNPDAVRDRYQLLSPQNNQIKRQKCLACEETGKRPVFLGGIRFYTEGDETYDPAVGCRGCAWAYPEAYREALQRLADEEMAGRQ